MTIKEGSAVAIEYLLKDDDGSVIDESRPGEPLEYLHGFGNLVPGLEAELEGKATGEKVQTRIEAKDGYGEVNEMLIQSVEKSAFGGFDDFRVGMQFQAQTQHGVMPVRITAVEAERVTVDGNHPLAGKALNFSVTVASIREATEEERAHGQLHAQGGCCGGGGCGSEECEE